MQLSFLYFIVHNRIVKKKDSFRLLVCGLKAVARLDLGNSNVLKFFRNELKLELSAVVKSSYSS